MSINLQKKTIKLNEMLCNKYGQAIVESDIIVPDTKPDILKVLHIDGKATITQKNIQNDKIIIQGIVKSNILYTPDGECIGNVKSMSATQIFTHVVEIKGATQNTQIFAEVELESIAHKYINSRKINIKTIIGVNVKAFIVTEIEVAVGTDEEEFIEKKSSIIRACNMTQELEKELIINERLELPQGRADIAELLKTDVKIFGQELRIAPGKADVKGELELSFLYIGEQENGGNLQFTQHNINFNDSIDAPETATEIDGEVDYNIKEINCDVVDDADGLRRILSVEICLGISINGLDVVEIKALDDAYSLNGNLKIKRGAYNIEQLSDKTNVQIAHRDVALTPKGMPNIEQIYNCFAVAKVKEIVIENNRVVINGFVDTNILYFSNDDKEPFCSYTHNSQFSQTVEIDVSKGDVGCDAKLDLEHLSYNVTTNDEVELRFIMSLSVKAIKSQLAEVVEDIEFEQQVTTEPRPSIVVYFVQKGDTLWDIAKKYRTKISNIVNNNKLESEKLAIGQKLII